MVKLIVLVITQDHVSVLYTGHFKEPEGLFEKELGTAMPRLLCIRLLSLNVLPWTGDGFYQEGGVESD